MREHALRPADRPPAGCLLFLNLHPQEINDPSLLEPPDTVIAGRIEDENDCQIAVDLGCDWLQGYHFGAPQPPFAEPKRS